MNVISYVPKILIIVVMMVVLFGFVIPVLSTSFALDWTDPENADENLELITGKVEFLESQDLVQQEDLHHQ